jgi:hypothetical protein
MHIQKSLLFALFCLLSTGINANQDMSPELLFVRICECNISRLEQLEELIAKAEQAPAITYGFRRDSVIEAAEFAILASEIAITKQEELFKEINDRKIIEKIARPLLSKQSDLYARIEPRLRKISSTKGIFYYYGWPILFLLLGLGIYKIRKKRKKRAS